MFNYSMQENFIRMVKEGANKSIPLREFIDREITHYKTSKEYKWIVNGCNYYEGRQDILQKQRTAIGQGGELENIPNLPNSRNIDNQYKKMVKQKTNYLVGKPFSIQSENSDYADLLNLFFNKSFFRQLKNVTTDSLNAGLGWLYCYYDENGEFSFKRFNPYELIPGWTDADHTKLDYMIRFYNVDCYDGKEEKKLTKVEYYTLDGIDYFEKYNGTLVPCEPYHTSYFQANGQEYNWTKLPFVPFKYNNEEIPLIVNCKSLQDGLNTILSNFQDNMEEDIRNTVMVLVNFSGTDLGEFRRNLATYGAVKVRSSDGVQGDVKTLQVQVNADNYKAIIEIFKKAIVENCMGFDAKDDKSGTPNQMNIQSMYSDIDLDASDMEIEYQASLEELIYFINLHLANTGYGDFDNEVVDITFNTNMPMDESSTISNIQKSVGILSTETLITQHPWVTNAQIEIDKVNQEKQDNIEQYGDIFGSTKDDNEEVQADDN